MDTSVGQMNLMHETMADAVHKVQSLSERMDEISTLVQVIQSMADQTNLLALNASIEAARAGEHGSGFVVVAGEIRKLADQVMNSVQNITEIVQHIQIDSNEMVEALATGYDQVQEGSEQIQLTGEAFANIQLSISNVVDKITIVSKYLGDISQQSLHVNDYIERIAGVSDEVVAGVGQTSASIESTNVSIGEVLNSADRLSQLAEKLNEQAKSFKT